MSRILLRRAGPALAALLCTVSHAAACSVALAFAVDVSGSVSPAAYAVQMRGLATALRAPAIASELARGEAALTLTQWTGRRFQHVSVPWTPIASEADVAAFARAVEAAPRAWSGANTALGDALAFTGATFAEAPACDRRIIDVSGNGRANEGTAPRSLRAGFDAAGLTVNAIVLDEGGELGLARYFADEVVAGPGAFVVQVAAPEEYPEQMRRKLLRELAVQMVHAE